ncbi:MAG: trypsin-like peptidase domain-containing protein [Thaumarchaeota archaeon]|nr:trypsin-like peptidase domain-containing protein [Nitrososphaerota archaeon]MCL5317781.1 trypsin-like peptidase domain-containing protein [Nitrososphaerota archaeon]
MPSRSYTVLAVISIIALIIAGVSAYIAFDTVQRQQSLLESNSALVQSTGSQISQLQTSLDGVKTRLQSIESASTDLGKQLSKLFESSTSLSKNVSASDAKLSGQFSALNQTTSGSLADLKSRLETQNTILSGNLTRTSEDLKSKLAGLSSNLSSIQSEINVLNSNLSGLVSKFPSANKSTVPVEPPTQTPVEVYKSSYKSIVVIRTPIGQGSGFIYNRSNLIATNWHVVNNATSIEVQFYDRSRSNATIVGTDAYSDVAIIKVENPPADAKPLELGNSSALYIGQQVIAIGNPLGMAESLSSGFVSQINQQINLQDVPIIIPVLQLDITIAPGSSGGPLFDLSGKVVGITNAGTGQGFNFAVPSNVVKRVGASLIAKGVYSHPYFGFSAISLSPEIIRALNITNLKPTQTGLLITNVTPGLPAAKAGLTPAAPITRPNGTQAFLAKDIILAVNGQPMLDFSDWQVYIEEHVSPGQIIKLTLWRSGETVTVDVTPTERPQHPI